jgi:hypothetical protein
VPLALIDLRLNKKQIENIVAQLKKLIDQLERAESPVNDAARASASSPASSRSGSRVRGRRQPPPGVLARQLKTWRTELESLSTR